MADCKINLEALRISESHVLSLLTPSYPLCHISVRQGCGSDYLTTDAKQNLWGFKRKGGHSMFSAWCIMFYGHQAQEKLYLESKHNRSALA